MLIKQVSKRFNSLYKQNITPWVFDKIPSTVVKFSEFVLGESGVGTLTLLDLGCGMGWLSSYFAQQGFKVEGIDSSKSAIAQARKKAKKQELDINFKTGNALDFPYTDNLFDAIFDRGLLHHLPKSTWPKYLEGVSRILKPGGLFYLGVFSDKSNKNGFSPKKEGRLWNRYRDERTGYENYDHFFNRKLIEELFGDFFKIISIEIDAKPSHTGSLLLHAIMRMKS